MDTVTALATAPAVLALVTLAKDLGVPSKVAPALAVVLGIGLSVADYSFGGTGVYAAVTSGLTLGLGAAGLYDAAKIVKPEIPAPEVPERPAA